MSYDPPVLDRLRTLPLGSIVAGCAGLVVLSAGIDWITGPDVQVVLLYLVPVLAVAWYAGPRWAGGFAVATTAISYGIALATPDGHRLAIASVNAALRFVLLVLAIIVIDAERRHLIELRSLASTDPLTRALNRRAFGTAVERHLSVAGVAAGTMLYLDVDGLKALNDTHGHDAGDEHLVALAEIIRASIRSTDHFARVGGDEFAVFLPGQDVTTARMTAARLLETCAARSAQPIRLSIGLSVPSAADSSSIEPLLRRADDVMYEAKRSGGGIRIDEPAADTHSDEHR